VFSFNLTTPGMSFVAALQGKKEEKQQPRTHQVAGLDTNKPRVPCGLTQTGTAENSQSVRAPNVKSLSLDKLLKVVLTIVQQIMTESNGAVSDEAKMLSFTIVLNLMEQNGQWN
jgi:hypothetical protein